MRKLCNVHNIGIYIIDSDNAKRRKVIEESLYSCVDGFDELFGNEIEEYRIIIDDIANLEIPSGAIVVPDNAYFYEGIFYSKEAKIAFQIRNNDLMFWAYENMWYLPYMIQLLLEKQNMTFVHGAAVAEEGKGGSLLLAFGGIGKTCFVANAIKKESVKLLGDDLIIVNRDGFMLGYPRPFCLYGYHRKLFPQFFKNKKVRFVKVTNEKYLVRAIRRIKIKLGIKGRVVYDYLPVSPIHLFGKEKFEREKVPVENVYILRRITGIDEISVHECLDSTHAASFAHDVIQHEWSVGLRLEYNYYAHQEKSFIMAEQEQYSTILRFLNKARVIYYVDIPEKTGAEEISLCLNSIILGRK